jgi:hypothetical protein
LGKTAKISIIAGVTAIFILLLYFFGGQNQDGPEFNDDWSEHYDPNKKSPYGTYMLKELLDTAGLFGNFLQLNVPLEASLEDEEDVNDIYFFVGNTNFLPDSSAEYLMDFVESGNTAFISTRSFPYRMVDELFTGPYEEFESILTEDTVQYLKFTHSDLSAKRYKFESIYNNQKVKREWMYFEPDNFRLPYSETSIVLGKNTKDKWNFVKIRYGDGYLFLHSTPYCFTNISIMKRDGFQYAERVLEHIPPGRVQWDKYNLEYHSSNNSGDQDDSGGGEDKRSPLEFILRHPPLVWALLLLLVGGVLYIFFKGKRMQEIIPAAELKENTSLRYVNTLSSLYMQQGSHSKLIQLKEKTFLNFIAERYYITTSQVDSAFIKKVAIKSQIEEEKIKEIFSLFIHLNKVMEVTDDSLIDLHKKIEYFYKKCR